MDGFDPVRHMETAFRLTDGEAEVFRSVVNGLSADPNGLTAALRSLLQSSGDGGLALKSRIRMFISDPNALADISGTSFFYGSADSGDVYYEPEDTAPVSRLLRFALEHSAERQHMIRIYGPRGSGRRTLLRYAAGQAGLNVLLAQMPEDSGARTQLYAELRTESLLTGAVLCFMDFDGGEHELRRLWEAVYPATGLLFSIGEDALRPTEELFVLNTPAPVFAYERHKTLCGVLTARFPVQPDADVETAAAGLTPGQIQAALQNAYSMAVSEGTERIERRHIARTSRHMRSEGLQDFGDIVKPAFDWSDLVLPPETEARLRCALDRMRHAALVYGQWGFGGRMSGGTGLHILMSGPPGTGKTMAAGILAKEIGVPLLRIDLSMLLSKYIGETEKNLGRVFDAVSRTGCALFFDEADTLFGKRTETKDSHDRYANMQVGYLLQRIEQHDGVTVLATNLMKNFDPAFLRRFHEVIPFPAPGAAERFRLWKQAFPPESPLSGDVDFDFLAETFAFTGGNIKNAALAAAFLAAGQGGGIGMTHLLCAVRSECDKAGIPANEEILRAWE